MYAVFYLALINRKTRLQFNLEKMGKMLEQPLGDVAGCLYHSQKLDKGSDPDRLYVTRPFMPPLEEFMPFLKDIWERKWLTNKGPYTEELERALCDYLGVEYVSLFSNGTIALLLRFKHYESLER